MEVDKIQKFIQKLSSETIQAKIYWERAVQFSMIDYDSCPAIANIFYCNEFQQIDFINSYYAEIISATIFIIFKTSESGRDGSRTQGYTAYIRYADDKITQLPCPQGMLYQLVNSINSYLATTEKPLEEFIDSYLNMPQ